MVGKYEFILLCFFLLKLNILCLCYVLSFDSWLLVLSLLIKLSCVGATNANAMGFIFLNVHS
jgi:hypothetical protein